MKITLVQAPFKNYAIVYPPLGLAYLAAALKRKPNPPDITIIDANAERLSARETADRILEAGTDLLGFTVTSPLVYSTLEIIDIVKSRRDIPIIVGGPHPTIMAEHMLQNNKIDCVARGEGEETICEYYDYLTGSLPIEGIKGISFKGAAGVIHNPDRPLICDLDSLPLPAWELFPLKKYHSIAGKAGFSLPVITSRGCPYDCVFCYKGIFGRTYRARDPEKILQELNYLVRNFKIDEFTVLDDNFALDEKRAIKICDEITKSGLNKPWRISNGIAAKSVSSGLFPKLKEAGCYQVAMGVESGSQRILDSIKKGVTLEQIRSVAKAVKDAGLETIAFFMIGNLGEDEKAMDETINFAIELDPDFAQFTIATPYPGTRMRQLILDEGKLLSDNWQDYASYGGLAVFEHGSLTPELMERKYKEAYRRFYLRPRYILRRLKQMGRPRELKNILSGLCVFIKMITARAKK